MSISNVAPIITSFLRRDRPEAIAIKGNWGTGKTHYWKQQLLSHAKGGIPVKRYSYVSLFGLNSLDQLRHAIFASGVPIENIGDALNLKALGENVRGVLKEMDGPSDDAYGKNPKAWLKGSAERAARKAFSAATQIQFARSWMPFVADAAFLTVRKHLICLDDFERVGSGLNTKDILGLVSMLKEERECKVALIFNEDALNRGTGGTEYSEYREKVVDIEVEFSPSVEEAISVVFPQSHALHPKVLERATVLKLTNIRLFQRIERVLEQLEPHLQSVGQSVRDNVLGTVVLFVWAFYTRDGTAPALEFLKKTGYIELIGRGIGKKKGEPEPEDSKWTQLLQAYKWTHTDELDLAVAHAIEKGYPDVDDLRERLANVEAQHKAMQGKGAFDSVWDILWTSFDDNELELVNAIRQAFEANAQYLSVNDLNQSVGLLRKLGHAPDADHISEIFVEANKAKPEMFRLDQAWMIGPIDDKLRRRLLEARGVTEGPKQMNEVVHRIVSNERWDEDDIRFLAKKTVDDYYSLLRNTRSRDVHAYIKALLGLGIPADKPHYKTVVTKTKKAVAKLGRESKINKFRLARVLEK